MWTRYSLPVLGIYGAGHAPLTNESGSGRPKNMRIRFRFRIRILNTALCSSPILVCFAGPPEACESCYNLTFRVTGLTNPGIQHISFGKYWRVSIQYFNVNIEKDVRDIMLILYWSTAHLFWYTHVTIHKKISKTSCTQAGGHTDMKSWATFTLLYTIMYNWYNTVADVNDVHTTKSRTRVNYSLKELAHLDPNYSWIFSTYNT